MDTVQQLQLAVVALQEQRNSANDTIVNQKIQLAILGEEISNLKMELNRLALEKAADDPYKPEIPEGVVA